jgi:K+-transporting ATPase ATPase A chain
MLNIALGEIIFGGVGSGLLGMLVFAILAVFIAGLMVGRTPEYLGKKIEGKEIKMAMLAVLILAASILGFSAAASVTHFGLAGRLNMGPHGLSEMLYAATSATGNNGSAFAGLSANTPFYNTILGLAMLIGRFLFIVPVMAIAGSLVKKKRVPESNGTFPTTGGLFVGLLIGVILIVGALTFFPAYALGPIVEHLLMQAGKLF